MSEIPHPTPAPSPTPIPSLAEDPTLVPPVQPSSDKLSTTQAILILGAVTGAVAFILFAIWIYVSA